MLLKYLQVVNYKNLKSTKFTFDKGANTIIGENDSGKSNAMTALRILLDDSFYYNSKRLKESDFSDSLGDWNKVQYSFFLICFRTSSIEPFYEGTLRRSD